MTIILLVTGILSIIFLGLFVWMKWRMRASKATFALTTVSSLVTCFIFGVSSISSSVPIEIISKLSEVLGYGTIESDSSFISYSVFILTCIVMFSILLFGIKAIKHWEAPVRVSEINLADNYLENNITSLAHARLKILLSGKSDVLASEAFTNWKERSPELPTPIEAKDLLRDLLTAAIREIQIKENGWRDDGKLWVGEILGLKSPCPQAILALVFDASPTQEDLHNRIDSLKEKISNLETFKVFAIYISRGKDKESHRTVKIESQTIEVFSSRCLILKGLDLHNYARELLNNFKHTKVGGTDATLESSYVDLFITKQNSSDERVPFSDMMSDWTNRNENIQLAITGTYGQGKSTALLKYCCDWAEDFLSTNSLNERVPLLIELRGKSPLDTSPLDFLSTWCTRYYLLPKQVMNLIKAGEAIVIFEGFDELKNAGRAFHRHQHFNALWRFSYPGTKLIFTGRPNFFLDEEEANRTLRNEKARSAVGAACTEVWHLQKMEKPQIALACRSYSENVKIGIIQSISDNEAFMEIVSRPSMLPVVATIWNDIAEIQKSGTPLTGAVLIERYIQAVFLRKEEELRRDRISFDAPSGSRYLHLPRQVRELLTLCVAWRMSGMKLKNTIPRSEITEMVRYVYNTLFTLAKAKGVAPEICEGLIEFERRYEDETLAERVEAITTEICSSGLLVPDQVGGTSNLRFPHKQFFEFMVAKAVFIIKNRNIQNGSKIISDSSNERLIFTRLTSEPNSIRYLAECTGSNLSTIYSPSQRVFLRITMAFFSSAYSIIHFNSSLLKKLTTKNSSDNGADKTSELNSRHSIKLEVGSDLNIEIKSNVKLMAMLLLGVLFMVGTLIISGLLNKPTSVYSSLFATLPILFAIQTFLLSISTSAYSSNQIFILHQFLRTHWLIAGQSPKNRHEEISLAIKSLSKGIVIYPTNQIEYLVDSKQFLYPANYFDGA